MKKFLAVALALAMMLSVLCVPSFAAPIKNFQWWETQANELETFVMNHSESAATLRVLMNCTETLIQKDANGRVQPCIAETWETPNSKDWTFHLRKDAVWCDVSGAYTADVIAEDFLWGMEYTLNAAKNENYNTSMPSLMITGAEEYNAYTKQLVADGKTDEAMALGLDKFKEMVAMEAPDDNTLVVHCPDEMPYFITVCGGACVTPISGELLANLGAAGFKTVNNETLWYNGPYIMTKYIDRNEKVLTPNPNWWGADTNTRFDTVTIKMIESIDVGLQMYEAGEIDQMQLTASSLQTIKGDPTNKFYNYASETKPSGYSYQVHWNYDKRFADGTHDVNWNTAVANEAFRLAWYYGIEWTPFLATINAINPESCRNYGYTFVNVGFMNDGTDYTRTVASKLGYSYDVEGDCRYDAAKGAEYKAKAMEELTALGVTFPINCTYYIKGSDPVAKDNADALKQVIYDSLGEDFINFDVQTYISSFGTEVRTPRLHSIAISGWGADFDDPVNFLSQETYGETSAYYQSTYGGVNFVDDTTTNAKDALIDTYKEFTTMVNSAKVITTDNDARMNAFADAEKFMLDHALSIPVYYRIDWELTKVDTFNRTNKFINYTTDDAGFTAEQMKGFKAIYDGTAE